MRGFLAFRQRAPEWMDRPDAPDQQLRQALRYIRRINRMLGYTRATIHHLEQFSRSWKPGEPIRIIDLATGSADVPQAILRWTDQRGFNIQIVAVDRQPETLRLAAAENSDPRLQLVQADVLKLPFADGSFDYCLTSMFLHHLDDQQVVEVLRTMGRLARRGVVVADLLRHWRAYAWIWLFTACASQMVKHDARISVAQAFTRTEILHLRDLAGLSFAQYHEHFAHRFVLAGCR